MQIEKIATEIIAQVWRQKLTDEVEHVKSFVKDFEKMTLEQLRAVLAYELLEDGSSSVYAKRVWEGRDPQYNNPQSIIRYLKLVFGY